MKSCGGTNQATDRVLPAQQRLQRGDPPGGQLDLGLVGDFELTPLERAAEIVLQFQPRHGLLVQPRREDLPAIPARRLRPVQRHVGEAQQIGGGRFGRGAERDPDADRHPQLAPVDDERCPQPGAEPRRDARRLRQFDPLTEQDREFIATEPRQRIAVAQRALQASRRRDQQLIPDGVAEAVVDRLEAIEIEEEDGTAP